MELLNLQEILKAVDGEIYIKGCAEKYSEICTDTRKMVKDSIFIALKGDNFNGNDFVGKAVSGGAVVCIIDELKFSSEDLNPEVTVIKVRNTREALRELAKYYRNKLDIKIIGITGSTGKTSTKDLVAAALSGKYKVFKTKGNFNNEIGLPLMIFKLDSSYDVAVLEMGMSNLNEIHRLADVARPDIGIITNIGISHIENLKSRENILKAKLEITDFFRYENTLIINGDNDLLSGIDSTTYKVTKIGIEKEYDYGARNILLKEDSIQFQVYESGNLHEKVFNLPIPGRHNISNSLLAIACGRQLGMEFCEIAEGLKNLEVTSMRLDIVKTDSYTIIDDCYNASPDSMKAAIDVELQIAGRRRIAVLGTMRELGSASYDAHKEIGSYAKAKGIDMLMTVGEFNAAYEEGYGSCKNFLSFDNNSDAVDYLLNNLENGDIILVKASRAMRFESIVAGLKK